MNKQTVYIPTKVEDELPPNNLNVFCLDDNNFETEVVFEDGVFYVYYSGEERVQKDNVTHWLKPTEAYVFTQEDLEQLLSDTFRAGENYENYCNYHDAPDENKYIENFLKK
jgi:hypothetical protein